MFADKCVEWPPVVLPGYIRLAQTIVAFSLLPAVSTQQEGPWLGETHRERIEEMMKN